MTRRFLRLILISLGCTLGVSGIENAEATRVLNFQADNGFAHKSKQAALSMVKDLGKKNGWEVVTTRDATSLTKLDLKTFKVVIFNNNCGNKGPVMTPDQQKALQAYVQQGGGFLGIHCAGALWKEGGEFQAWYEGLIGTTLVDHSKVQEALLHVEDRTHIATSHLPKEWRVTDEWHRFGSNPREKVSVLISVDENSYEGKQKMGGDHPFTWHQEYDGGRSFFTSLGHTKEMYADEKFQKMIEGAIRWTGNIADVSSTAKTIETELPVGTGLILDLDADKGVDLEDGNKVKAWHNQIKGHAAEVFVKRDKGRKVPGSGRPSLKKKVPKIGGHNTLVFKRQELINMDEDAFDHLLTGNGYTWISVMSVGKQAKGKKDVHSFFGNLKNGSNYEGIWGCLDDDDRVWMGSRGWPAAKKGKQQLWDDKNPKVFSPKPLAKNTYYLVMGRMGAGQGSVDLELFVNSATAVDSKKVPVNPKANSSLMAIGQERDATNHPGFESFIGEISRFLIFDRPLTQAELSEISHYLMGRYEIGSKPAKE